VTAGPTSATDRVTNLVDRHSELAEAVDVLEAVLLVVKTTSPA